MGLGERPSVASVRRTRALSNLSMTARVIAFVVFKDVSLAEKSFGSSRYSCSILPVSFVLFTVKWLCSAFRQPVSY